MVRKHRYLAGGAIAVLALAGCSSADSGEESAAGAAPEDCIEIADDAVVEQGVLNIGTNATLPPLSYVDADGEIRGQRWELGEELGARLCLDVAWTNAQATSLQPSMEAGRIDIVDIGYFVTEERIAEMRMIPTERMGISVSVAAGNPRGVESVEDLSGLTLGAAVSSFEEATLQTISDGLVEDGLDPIDIRSFDEYDMVFQALSAGQVDSVATTSPVAAYYADKGGFDAAIEGLELTDTALVVSNGPLADAVIEALDAMKADGSYDALIADYSLEPVDDFAVQYTGE
ncbi:transporter substrate-binding domain-containing protein [Microbacterium betulae]|uniref:Transporter substrate-binding domain-containing protein n=1 Tax=Microbacterium betulae TaxID=2981139 RepID=A0AA97I530_9MICO|nr:transporter substrate-binding domain-containing protein [Microbacterium sp. AB]WOF23251.1 transporter substrate-binding domain-containing protein [Microbacterium sp. AB]